jgi:diguanylate cyclase (GGDEF)-like protein/PAS domain S-box-containing protein
VHEIVIPSLYLLAGIMVYAMVHHFAIAINSPRDRTQMLFAGICMSAALLAIFHARNLDASGLVEFVWALKWTIGLMLIFMIFFIWFVALHTGKLLKTFLVALSVLFAVLLVVNLTLPDSLQYDQIDGLHTLLLPWGERVTRVDGHHGYWAYVTVAVVIVAFGYILYAMIEKYIRSRRILDLCMLCAVGLFLAGSTIGILARLSLINFVEPGPITILAMVMVMSVAFTNATQYRLRSSERRFRSLVEQSPFSIQVLAPDGHTRLVNPAWEELWGMKLEQIANYNILHDRQLFDKGVMSHIERGFAGEATEISPIKYDPADNPVVSGPSRDCWVQSHIYPIKDESGKIVDVILMHQNVTEHKLMEDSLRESEARFRTIIEQSPMGMSFSRDGYTVDINPAFLKMFGYDDVAEVRGTPVINRVAPQCRAEVESRIRRRAQGEAIEASYETIGLRKDGSEFPMFVSAQRVMLNDGPMSSAFLIDFTERKRSEMALRESETRFRTIIEQSPIGMALGRDGITVEVNPVYLKMFGYDDIAEVCGQPLINQIAPQCRAQIEDRIRKRIQGIPTEETYETIGLRKDGSQFPLVVSAKRIVLNDGPMTFAFLIDFTERKAAEESINQLAFYDPLTGLPNRRLLMDRLQHALASGARRGRHGALLFIDLDNFKTLNDSMGHVTGDALLQQVPRRLASCVRDDDTVARFGGDEFVVILEDLSENALEAATQTEAIGEKVLAGLNQPYQLDTDEYRCTASIGAALFNNNQQTTDELLKQADIAMYQAKKAGRNILRFFDPQMQDTINTRVTLEGKLHKALESGQFGLHYQIQVDSSGSPIGAEALIRWTMPENGPISPKEFIPLAEDTGLILQIGEWVLKMACTQLKKWENSELTRKLALSVNISAKQFIQADFVTQTQAILRNYAIAPHLLKLELTESMLLENIEDTIVTMDRLRESGVRFSLDDFGTGYSSLQYLKRLPLDQLKIDQSFVRDIAFDSSDRAIVTTIIAMAKSLGLEVIAEGVETEEQRLFLSDQGCTHYQGYLFGKPVPVEQFEALLLHH